MTYRQALDWLYSAQSFGIKLGLEHPRALAAALGNPHHGLQFLHVAGTNGKGSVCAFADSILRQTNIRTGLFTSPHLVDFRERIRIDGRMIPKNAVAEGLGRLRDITEHWPAPPTFFELTTALALDWFRACETGAVVLETGMGGRLDATNIVAPRVCVITPVAMDHQQWLGRTLPAIAAEKAGIVKPGVPLVLCPQQPEVAAAIESVAGQRAAPVHHVRDPWTSSDLALTGPHQAWNAAAAVAACRLIAPTITRQTIVSGLRTANWPGRFQRIGGRVVLDGAHNPAAAQALLETWQASFGSMKASVVFGALQDKSHPEITRLLAPIVRRFFFVPVDNPRAANTGDFDPHGLPAEICTSVFEAISRAMLYSEKILIAGSLFLVGAALELLRQKPPAWRF